MLTFEADTHTYKWNGVRVPNVTQLLRDMHTFAGVPLAVLEAAQQRGTDVHAACHFLDEDDLDEVSLDSDVAAYLRGYKRFLLDCQPNWAGIEERVYHRALGYAGTLDRRGDFFYKDADVKNAVVDLKTSEQSYPVIWEPQLIAYAKAAGCDDARRFTLQLRKDGSYRLREWTDPSAWPVFMSLLTINKWATKHGVTNDHADRETAGAV